MPHISVYIHFVWATKYRVPHLYTKEIRQVVWQHIRENAREKDIFVDFVSGYAEHCHCLVSLGPDQTIQKVMQYIKGESAYWINKQGLLKEKFEWQRAYYAGAVSERHIEIVRNYIRNQENHHAKNSFREEYNSFFESETLSPDSWPPADDEDVGASLWPSG